MHVWIFMNKNSTYHVVKKDFLVTMRPNELFGSRVCSKIHCFVVAVRRNELFGPWVGSKKSYIFVTMRRN